MIHVHTFLPLVQTYICSDSIHSELQEIADNPSTTYEKQARIAREAPEFLHRNKTGTWADFVAAGLSTLNAQGGHHLRLFQKLNQNMRNEKAARYATHQEKRDLVRHLELGKIAPEIYPLLAKHPYGSPLQCEAVKEALGLEVIYRERRYNTHVPMYRRLVELQDHIGDPRHDILVTGESFLRIPARISAVVISPPTEGFPYGCVELVVKRDFANDMVYGRKLLKWVQDAILEACDNRRDVRPSHAGKMVQVGLNMGPRHRRILGYAKSFTANLDDEERRNQDEKVIGCFGLFWHGVVSFIPGDITAPVRKCLEDEYPQLGTRDIPSGPGFTVVLDGKHYVFSQSQRGPPEGILTAGYAAHTHRDPAYCRWAFGFTAVHDRSEDSELPEGHGSNYVDMTLGIVVESGDGTLTAFQPDYLHGTTYAGKIVNYGLSATMTRRVRDGFEEFIKEGKPVVFAFQSVDEHKN
ncbi:hypothetical protein Moror_9731 [Moniliophthora roreri MCA 2997]|uniref:Uncharacterized protein n=1 Tax=Moniliophthora roreri (strain MCA 2997) TaxID=1381753 RepID=V2WYJ5_MONRO|nr:hypothetical protein Moror_9731 [Moniliophthora roreri MCA 2997]